MTRSAYKVAAVTRRVLLLCAMGMLIAACASGGSNRGEVGLNPNGQFGDGQPGQPRPTVKVALLLPLSGAGNAASLAKALKQAGELALFDLDNPTVTLTTKDTKGTPEGAKAAATAAVQEGAELVVGPLFAKSVRAASEVTRQAKIPMVAFSSDQSVAGNGVYLLSFLAGRDVPTIVGYTISQGRRNFGALIPKSPYGRIVENAFRQAVNAQGGQVVVLEHFQPDANSMLEPAKRVAEFAKSPDPTIPPQIDALFIPVGQGSLPTVAALVPYNEIDTTKVKLIGTGLWDYPNVGREKPLVGGWFPAPDPKGWRGFSQRYVKAYETTPPRLASLSYDAVGIAIALSQGRPGQRYSAGQLTRSQGFTGVDGLFRLLPNGTSQRGLAILEVQKFGTRVIQPAPLSFSRAQF
ncbi:MAG: penicillin-binding protein activator [Hyphomicrobiaceae bacterium]|nr:penicillin-binding protein activator [Hyphomicrobiaceae bacterium]